MKTVVAGGTGFLGKAIVHELAAHGHSVTVVSRSGAQVEGAIAHLKWDGSGRIGDWADAVDGADAVVNLAGEPINQRWTPEAKRRIVDSRAMAAKAIGLAWQAATEKPRVWLNASAVGYYGHTEDAVVEEDHAPGTGFLAETTVAWEKAVDDAAPEGARVVKLRIGVVLGRDGGAFPQLLKLTKAFAGGAVGSGRQFLPWIHIEDLAAMARWCLESEVSGPVNGTAPYPASNADFMAALRREVGRPWAPPAPAFAMRLVEKVAGIPAELVLEGARVVPRKALQGGFQFRYPELPGALEVLV